MSLYTVQMITAWEIYIKLKNGNLIPYPYQRPIDTETVNRYATVQEQLLEKYGCFDFPGMLTILPGSPEYILDGQHRCQAIVNLAQNKKYISRLKCCKIAIGIRSDLCGKEQQTLEVYRLLNQCNIINPSIGTNTITTLQRCQELENILRQRYPGAFIKNTRPYVDVRNLVQELNDNPNLRILSVEEVLDKLDQHNEAFREHGFDAFNKWGSEAVKHGLYLATKSPKARWAREIK